MPPRREEPDRGASHRKKHKTDACWQRLPADEEDYRKEQYPNESSQPSTEPPDLLSPALAHDDSSVW
jgi:hypothetical protein